MTDAPKTKEGLLEELRVAQQQLTELQAAVAQLTVEAARRTQSKRTLQESRQRYERLYSSMSEGMALHEVVYDDDGRAVDYRILDVNPAFAAHTQLTPQDAVGRLASECFGTGEAPYLERYARVASSGEPSSFETYFEPMGKHFKISAFCPAKGQFATVFTDITNRRRAEEALQRSERWLQSIFRVAPTGIGLVRNTILVEVNHRICELTGYSHEELVGQSIQMLSPNQDELLAMGRGSNRQLPDGGVGEVEARWRRKDRSTIDVLLASTPMSAIDPSEGIVFTALDMSERKRAEARLVQADRLASMGVIAAGVGHEINNPLTYVLYNVQGLAEDVPKLAGAVARCCGALREAVGPEAFATIAGDEANLLRPPALADLAEQAKEAVEGALRIKNVTQSLNTFGRNENQELSGVDLTHPIESAARMASNEIRYRARLVKELDLVPNVWASEPQLAQLFLNLLANAAHSIDEGHAEQNVIKVRTWAEGENVFAEVSDTGSGIAPKDLVRIFEPFFTTRRVGQGAGLGLSVCRNIVVGLGGDLWVESEVGHGSRFIVRLPTKPRTLPAIAHSVAPVDRAVSARRGRILVVDDETVICRSLTRLLGRDHEMVTVSSGSEARAILESNPAFDVILCDLIMPDVTGMELHAWLTEARPTLARRTVFITGGAFTPNAKAYLASVDNPRIEKPFDPRSLKKIVDELIEAARQLG